MAYPLNPPGTGANFPKCKKCVITGCLCPEHFREAMRDAQLGMDDAYSPHPPIDEDGGW